MEKAASNGQFRNLVGSLNMIPDDAIDTINGIKIQKAIDELGKGITQAEFLKWINNGCQLTTILANAFTVGDIFRHRAETGDKRLWLSDNTQNWLIKPNLKKIIQIRTNLPKLREYCLPKNMDDSLIQKNNSSGLMDEETFLCVMYLLIFQPELGKQVLGYALSKEKYYVFHVLVNGKKVAFIVYSNDGEWTFDARDFDDNDWDAGDVFLSFATV